MSKVCSLLTIQTRRKIHELPFTSCDNLIEISAINHEVCLTGLAPAQQILAPFFFPQPRQALADDDYKATRYTFALQVRKKNFPRVVYKLKQAHLKFVSVAKNESQLSTPPPLSPHMAGLDFCPD